MAHWYDDAFSYSFKTEDLSMNLMNQCMTYSPNVFLVMLNGELNTWLRPDDFQTLDLKTGGTKKGRGVDR